MTANPFSNQISNRNFLSPVGFKFTLAKEPKVAFFCNSAKIPDLSFQVLEQETYLKNLDVPGGLLEYGDLTLRFLVDEDLVNYMAIHNWLTGLGFPETTQQYRDLISDPNDSTQPRDPKRAFSDGSLYILDSNYNTNSIVKFKDLFPFSLTSLDFDATKTDIQYFTAEVKFKYTIYNIIQTKDNSLRTFKKPTVSLTSDNLTPFVGDEITLYWEAAGATTVSIDNGIGSVDPKSGSIKVIAPNRQIKYTIIATGSGGITTSSVTIRPQAILPPPTIELTSSDITPIFGSEVTLSWITNGAYRVIIDNGIGEVYDVNGSINVTITDQITYTATAIGSGGSSSSSVTITPQPTIELTSSNTTPLLGEEITLTWTTTGATSVSIDNGIGEVYDVNGSISLLANEQITYTATATGHGGSSTSSVTITPI